MATKKATSSNKGSGFVPKLWKKNTTQVIVDGNINGKSCKANRMISRNDVREIKYNILRDKNVSRVDILFNKNKTIDEINAVDKNGEVLSYKFNYAKIR